MPILPAKDGPTTAPEDELPICHRVSFQAWPEVQVEHHFHHLKDHECPGQPRDRSRQAGKETNQAHKHSRGFCFQHSIDMAFLFRQICIS